MTRIMIGGAKDNLKVVFGMIRKYLESPNDCNDVNFLVEDRFGNSHDLTFKKVRNRIYKSRKKQSGKLNYRFNISINALVANKEQ